MESRRDGTVWLFPRGGAGTNQPRSFADLLPGAVAANHREKLHRERLLDPEICFTPGKMGDRSWSLAAGRLIETPMDEWRRFWKRTMTSRVRSRAKSSCARARGVCGSSQAGWNSRCEHGQKNLSGAIQSPWNNRSGFGICPTRLLKTQDEERRRLARELHDSAGQIVAALSMGLANMTRQAMKEPPLAKTLKENQELLQQLNKKYERCPTCCTRRFSTKMVYPAHSLGT